MLQDVGVSAGCARRGGLVSLFKEAQMELGVAAVELFPLAVAEVTQERAWVRGALGDDALEGGPEGGEALVGGHWGHAEGAAGGFGELDAGGHSHGEEQAAGEASDDADGRGRDGLGGEAVESGVGPPGEMAHGLAERPVAELFEAVGAIEIGEVLSVGDGLLERGEGELGTARDFLGVDCVAGHGDGRGMGGRACIVAGEMTEATIGCGDERTNGWDCGGTG